MKMALLFLLQMGIKKQATKFDGDRFRSLLKGCMSQGHIYHSKLGNLLGDTLLLWKEEKIFILPILNFRRIDKLLHIQVHVLYQ